MAYYSDVKVKIGNRIIARGRQADLDTPGPNGPTITIDPVVWANDDLRVNMQYVQQLCTLEGIGPTGPVVHDWKVARVSANRLQLDRRPT